MVSFLHGRTARVAVTIAAAVIIGAYPQLIFSNQAIDKPPSLLRFDVIETEWGVFKLVGQVEDEFPEGCYVRFGGALEGFYAVVHEDGHFGEVFEVGYSYGGPVSAQAIDYVDQASNVLWDEIQ